MRLERTVRAIPILFVFAIFPARIAGADVRLPAILSDGMVLQRDAWINLWGWADPGETVRVRVDWSDEIAGVETGADGRWRVRLRSPRAGGPHEIEIEGRNAIRLRDVLVGEVWVCSGQSNMEWPLRASDGAEEEIPRADHPEIRLFQVARAHAFAPAEDCRGAWARCTPASAAGFSAVAYWFGLDLHRALGIPVGLVESAWGGTPAEAWTPVEALVRRGPLHAPLLETRRSVLARERDRERELRELPARLAAWREAAERADPGFGERWMAPDFDDASWGEAPVPGFFRDFGLGEFDGTVWYRASVEIPAAWAGRDLLLELGPVDDLDVTFFDGERVGAHDAPDSWTAPRAYPIPGRLVRAGRTSIAVRVHDTGGAGGFSGEPATLRIRLADDETSAIPLAGKWRVRPGVSERDLPPQPRPPSAAYQNVAGMLFDAMIAPIVPFAIRGAIWYQGEANVGRAYEYRTLFPEMIRAWREAWGQGDFPFYFVQLAPFRYGGASLAQELREAQFLALRSGMNLGMAVTMDIGNPGNIHPRNKRDVGERLARWAKAKTYANNDVLPSGPLYRSIAIENDRIRVFFDFAGSGLATRDGAPPSHFEIAGRDRLYQPATAVIDGDTVVVRADAVREPVAVRYAWSDDAEPNLANRGGLPASSFRTDDWIGLTEFASRRKPRAIAVPLVDLDGETPRQTIVDREPGQYLGHPTTVLLEDGRTMLAVYPKGHGGGAIVMKRSTDGGLTWSERLPVPASFTTSREVPTIYRIEAPDGARRLILFSGLHPIRRSISEDDGTTWSELEPIGTFGGIVAMSDLLRLRDGSTMAVFHDDGRFLAQTPAERERFVVYKTLSRDGGLTWGAPEPIASREDAALCEPGLVRSPDGRMIAALLRENSRRYNSMVIFSRDEGRTWSEPVELPAALTGDRHRLRYAPDGRLVASFRDTAHESPTKGDWVGWVGTFDDLEAGRDGQYRIRFKDNKVEADCGYPAIEILPDGTFVITTYGHWIEGESPFILSVRFRLEELDARVPGR